MGGSRGPASVDASQNAPRRSSVLPAAIMMGVPLATGILALISYGPFQDTDLPRYVSHTVEKVEVFLFCGALGAFASKLWRAWLEKRSCRRDLLPKWDGSRVELSQAHQLLAGLSALPRRLRRSAIGSRTIAILDFLCRRGSAVDLDDHLRTLADNDALALENSYALTRFITWAIPILGFLGTVLGITGAISGVTPEKLETDLNSVTDGLALAFDATALALALTMIAMFTSFITERAEQAVLDLVDAFVDRELAHRFERGLPGSSAAVEAAQEQTNVVLKGMDSLVQRQADLWARSMAAAEERSGKAAADQIARMAKALETALERTAATQLERMRAFEEHSNKRSQTLVQHLEKLVSQMQSAGHEQQAAWSKTQASLATQLQAVAKLQDAEGQLNRLQEGLNNNLAALAGAGSFEQALHSLTAAIHLITARAATTLPTRPQSRPGNAA
ncbi:MAG TPA: MotA/TolQ/ExbB proton channel family protein [Gemmataceae bacterium]|nr:MotA/TolQ/ExbB proton channel family protein [Gemmataceae bacterium]